ncbi:HPP family protein [Rhodopila globiformis]|uniref:HPP transmembrane region domain-containing protein n=1 Tax=Rhodopila globiformis TaxID=1071 RepID=A0A2S6N4J5_RHOGL|nr:HPP family protein [Rhodopila globiformis]PPQ29519.1 hypothetical protein CCS01_21505 [Rhodopila globiformis]
MIISAIARPILAALVLGIIAALGIWTQEAWLAPSLGSAVFTQVLTPSEASARPYNLAVGQFLGAAAGFAAVFATGAAGMPHFMSGQPLVIWRLAAVIIATLFAAVLQLLFRAITPAGGATALVVAVGAEPTRWIGVLHLSVGILLVTVLGEAVRQVMVRLQYRDQRAG